MSAPSSSASVKVKRLDYPFGIVPNKLLLDKRISLSARTVAAWLIGRTGGFEIKIVAMQRMLGISEGVWSKIRKELEQVGWWQSVRSRGVSKKGKLGVWHWEHYFEYIDNEELEEKSIPVFSMDGESMDGESMPGEAGDIQIRSYKEEFTNKKNTKKKTTTSPVVVSLKSVEKREDGKNERSSGEDGLPQPLSVSLLITAGVALSQAKKLANSYTESRIRTVVRAGEGKKPGWIVKALEEEWSIAEIMESDSAQSQYEDDLKIWRALPPTIRHRFIKDRGFGSDFNSPDPAWLREKLEILEKEKKIAGV